MSKARALTDLALELAWRLWAQLGLSSWEESARPDAIDLEPLILFTSWIGQHDARLWEESVDWCVTNHHWVSATRLRRLFNDAEPDVAECFQEYGATVRRLAGVTNWPAGDLSRPIVASQKSRSPRLSQESLLQLRIRAALGPTARAEILRLLLVDRPNGWSVSEIANQVEYTKTNVASALELLRSGGFVSRETVGNHFRYRLSRAQQLIDFVGPVPDFQPDWTARFIVIEALVRSEHGAPTANAAAAAAELFGIARRIQLTLNQLGLTPLLPTPGGSTFGEQLERWMGELLSYWAGHRTFPGAIGARYRVSRDGTDWTAEVEEPELSRRPLSEGLRRLAQSVHVPSDGSGTDAASHSIDLANELFQDAFLRSGLQRASSRFEPEVHTFAAQELRSMPDGSTRTFDQVFLELWWVEHVARVGGRPVT